MRAAPLASDHSEAVGLREVRRVHRDSCSCGGFTLNAGRNLSAPPLCLDATDTPNNIDGVKRCSGAREEVWFWKMLCVCGRTFQHQGWDDIIHLSLLFKTRRKADENRVYMIVSFVIEMSNCNKPVTNVKSAYRLPRYKCLTLLIHLQKTIIIIQYNEKITTV